MGAITKKQENILVFSYPNGEISFHEDLKIYYEILSNIRSHTPSLLALLERANEPQDALDRVIDELLAVIKNYALPFLAQNDVYDSTVDDFLQDNTGYNRMFEALELYYKEFLSKKNEIEKIANSANASFAAEADKMVTGSGYRLISGDMLAQAVYAAQSERIIERQTAQAQRYFNEASRQVECEARKTFQEMKSTQRDVYFTQLRENIPIALDYIVSVCFQKLVHTGKVSASALNGIDENRSNTIMENLNSVPAKEQVICAAIQVCPYNISIYQTAYDVIDITAFDCFREILNYFGIVPSFCEWLIKSKGCWGDAAIESIYGPAQKLIQVIAFLEGSSIAGVSEKILTNKLRRDISLYIDSGEKIKHQESLESQVERVCGEKLDYNVSEYASHFQSYISAFHLTASAIECYQKLGLDVFKAISDAFGEEIDSFAQADGLILTAWKKEEATALDKYHQAEKNRLYEERQSLEEELNELKKKKPLNKEMLFVELLLFVFGIFMAGLGVAPLRAGGFVGFIFGLFALILGVGAIWAVIHDLKMEIEQRIDRKNKIKWLTSKIESISIQLD